MVGKLSDTVRLVGPTISCEGSPYKGDVQGEWRSNPHVQVGDWVWQRGLEDGKRTQHSMWAA